MKNNRPNVLFLMGDQHPYFMTGCYGNSLVKTPQLDALANSGTVFDAAYSPSPLCAPARAAMLTGRHVSEIEVWDNASPLRSDWPTFVHSFRAAGYRTVLSGKMHFVGPDQKHGFEERWTQEIYPVTFDWTYPSRDGVWVNPPGKGQAVHRVEESGVGRTWDMEYDEEVLFRTVTGIREMGRSGGDPGDPQAPFFLCVSFTGPHYPFSAPEEYWNLYRDEDIPLPEVPMGDLAEDPEYIRWFRDYARLNEPVSDEVCRRARRAALARITMVDDYCGQVIAALEEAGLKDDTIIVYTSDHGDMMGEHGLWFKQTAYEGSTRVPLIMTGPGIGNGRVAAACSLLDLGPTLCGLAGVEPVFESPAGRDISSHLEIPGTGSVGTSAENEGEAIVEFYGDGTWRGWRMIRRDDWKLIVVPDTELLLYNLQEDPGELINLAEDSRYRDIRDDLVCRVSEGWDPDASDEAHWLSQERRMAILKATGKGQPFEWMAPSPAIPHPNPVYRRGGGGSFTFTDKE